MLKSVAWLSTFELETFIKNFANRKTKAAFLGVFSIDRLPVNIPHLPLLFIINTNTSNLPGQHWKAIYINKNRVGEIFDSLATSVSLRLEQWMNTNTKKWSLSSLTLQNPLSAFCGGYVLYYIMTRLNYRSLSACIAPFTNDVFHNDRIIETFFNEVSK